MTAIFVSFSLVRINQMFQSQIKKEISVKWHVKFIYNIDSDLFTVHQHLVHFFFFLGVFVAKIQLFLMHHLEQGKPNHFKTSSLSFSVVMRCVTWADELWQLCVTHLCEQGQNRLVWIYFLTVCLPIKATLNVLWVYFIYFI